MYAKNLGRAKSTAPGQNKKVSKKVIKTHKNQLVDDEKFVRMAWLGLYAGLSTM